MMSNFKGYLKRLLKIKTEKIEYPYLVEINTFSGIISKYQINSPMESFRIERYGDEEEFTQLILNELRPDDIFFDIGACLGLVTVHAGKICKGVYSFEPEPQIRSHLKLNVNINGLNNIQIIDWAVSDAECETQFFSEGIEGRSPSLRNDSNRDAITVKCNSIDNAITNGELPYPNVIKLDIEGAEILALNGMKILLNSDFAPRTIFIEIHPTFLNNFNSSPDEILNKFREYGYESSYKTTRDEQIHCIFNKI